MLVASLLRIISRWWLILSGIDIFLVAWIGFAVGLLSTVLGLGGGAIIVPLLPSLVNVTAHETIATSLICIFIVAASNTMAFHRRKMVDWPLVLKIGPMTAAGSFVAAILTLWLGEIALRLILSALLLFFSGRVFYALLFPKRPPSTPQGHHPHVGIFWLIGLVSGAVSGLTGLGAGTILNPAIMHFRLTDALKVSASANGIMMFTTLFGALAFTEGLSNGIQGWRWGLIRLDIAILVVVSAWLITPLGLWLQDRVGERTKKWVFAVLLLILSLKVAVTALLGV